MIYVANGRCIRHLAVKTLLANRARNLVAVCAVALTALLFTALFTIVLSLNESAQQTDFRRVGSFCHGSFKNVTAADVAELQADPSIEAYGLDRFLGTAVGDAFRKENVSVASGDANAAHWMYLDPIAGRLPKEGTDEGATDLYVLELLGVEPEFGAEISLPIELNGRESELHFTLSGWWERDPAIACSQVILPESRARELLSDAGIDPDVPAMGTTGRVEMNVMLASSMHIEADLLAILARHGYVDEDGKPTIDIGVNWGYTSAKLAQNLGPETVTIMAAMLLVIALTGYLIIYNVFLISVSADVRHYGLLKAIGATGRQLGRIVRLQALALCAAGIPLGLTLGWFVGAKLLPDIIASADSLVMAVSMDWHIFAFSAVFALLTVCISCARPARMAARVAPVEAVRYVEADVRSKRTRRAVGGEFLPRMALANLCRSRRKTVVTLLSLALAAMLLNATLTLTRSFDLDKYVSQSISTDYILADAAYFQTSVGFHSEEDALTEAAISDFSAQSGITDWGRVYGITRQALAFKPEAAFRTDKIMQRHTSPEIVESTIEAAEHMSDGRMAVGLGLYGMEDFALSKLTVVEGDLSRLNEPGTIAAVVGTDTYGNIDPDSHWAKLGERVTLRYVDRAEYLDAETLEPFENADATPTSPLGYVQRSVEYTDVEYEVVARVTVPKGLSYRYRISGWDPYVLSAENFLRDTGCDAVMLCVADAEEDAKPKLEAYLADYTANVDSNLDYESKATVAAEFEGFRNLFLLLGGTLSCVVALVGALNFFNAILTSILTRRRELAMLQSIGMTGAQLKRMFILEALLLSAGALMLSATLWAILYFPLTGLLGRTLQFFTPRFVLLPLFLLALTFVLLGTLITLCVYRHIARQSIVDRLRTAEV